MLTIFSSLFYCSINNTGPHFIGLIFCDVTIPGFLAAQEPKNFFLETCLACSGSVYRSGPLVSVTRKILVAGTKFTQTLMAGPLGGAGRSPTAATTKNEDVDGGPPGGAVSRPAAATIEAEDVDGGPLGGAVGRTAVASTPLGVLSIDR
jgi:hypothetical protein